MAQEHLVQCFFQTLSRLLKMTGSDDQKNAPLNMERKPTVYDVGSKERVQEDIPDVKREKILDVSVF